MKNISKETKERQAKRNRKIWCRFVELTEKEKLRYDYAIKKICEDEFFLSCSRVLQILRNEAKQNDNKTAMRPKLKF